MNFQILIVFGLDYKSFEVFSSSKDLQLTKWWVTISNRFPAVFISSRFSRKKNSEKDNKSERWQVAISKRRRRASDNEQEVVPVEEKKRKENKNKNYV